jgi:hypothetical protein
MGGEEERKERRGRERSGFMPVSKRDARKEGTTDLEEGSDGHGRHRSVLLGDHRLELGVTDGDGGWVRLGELVERSDGGELEDRSVRGHEELKDWAQTK